MLFSKNFTWLFYSLTKDCAVVLILIVEMLTVLFKLQHHDLNPTTNEADEVYHNYHFVFLLQFCDEYDKTNTWSLLKTSAQK